MGQSIAREHDQIDVHHRIRFLPNIGIEFLNWNEPIRPICNTQVVRQIASNFETNLNKYMVRPIHAQV